MLPNQFKAHVCVLLNYWRLNIKRLHKQVSTRAGRIVLLIAGGPTRGGIQQPPLL